jgi:hypothetical protein
VQDFSKFDAAELSGYVEAVGSSSFRASVKLSIVKNGAGTYEVAASDIAGDDVSGAPLVSFQMTGSLLEAKIDDGVASFSSAVIKFALISPPNSAGSLSIDASSVVSGTLSNDVLENIPPSKLDKSIVRYQCPSGTSIPNNSEAIVNFSTASIDTKGEVTTGAAWKFTAQEAGYYRVDASLLLSSSTAWQSGEVYLLSVYKNGSVYQRFARTEIMVSSFNHTANFCGGSAIVQLDAGDYIDIRAFQNSDVAIAVQATEYSSLNIEQIG